MGAQRDRRRARHPFPAMLTVDFSTLPETERRSPTRKFDSYCRDVSLALGGIRNVGTWGGGHPFDFQIRRVPPGASVCPFHSHLGQWEAYFVRAGTATVRAGAETHAARTGDFFVHPPFEPHQLTNTGTVDLEVFIFADNPPVDVFYYPESNKWGLRNPPIFFRLTEADYFDGEEPGAPSGPLDRPPPVPPAANLAPFVQRKVHIDDLPWDEWFSPKRKFHGAAKELSIATGAKRNTPFGLGGHPFEVELSRLAPGERGCPFHSHAGQWELFIVLEGTATVRAGTESRILRGGEAVIHPPCEPHDITNTGDTDLFFFIVADNLPADYCHYPESQKWGLRAPRMLFRPTEVDYHDGEE